MGELRTDYVDSVFQLSLSSDLQKLVVVTQNFRSYVDRRDIDDVGLIGGVFHGGSEYPADLCVLLLDKTRG